MVEAGASGDGGGEMGGYGSGGQHPWKVLHDGYVLQDKVHVVPMKRVVGETVRRPLL